MTHPELFHIASDEGHAREAAQRLFETVRPDLEKMLPETAEVLHVGATAIPGCLTKGDLDIVARVEPGDFEAADAALASRFARNPGSPHTGEFAAFEDETRTPHLGIQLTVKGGTLDVFHRFAEALRGDPALVERYNALKTAHDGQPMERYRAAKSAFIADALQRTAPREEGT